MKPLVLFVAYGLPGRGQWGTQCCQLLSSMTASRRRRRRSSRIWREPISPAFSTGRRSRKAAPPFDQGDRQRTDLGVDAPSYVE